ncbi:AmmeMemoRadiSam system radical SAM enzyme [bacterium]|nr:AmmeMemoRadiSam system radical SAM enzyme [bacterium]
MNLFEKKIYRRCFIENCLKGVCALGVSSVLLDAHGLFASTDKAGGLFINSDESGEKSGEKESVYEKEARHYQKLDNNLVRCGLCPRRCIIPPDGRGMCGVRKNEDGCLKTLVYSRVCALHKDPIEKKPLYHYKPGTTALSVATPGCNIDCKFCQNWQISQARPEDIMCRNITPIDIVNEAKKSNCPSIAYTYSEPTIFYEYMYETALLGNEQGVKSIIITNGFINEKPQLQLLEQLDAVKIDLKSFTESFYTDICSGSLQPVLESLKRVKKYGKWLEIVVLIIPTLNDSPEEITEMANFISGELGNDVPVHFSRFHPQYKIKNLPSTPILTLQRCRDICMEKGLNYVYIGNAPGHPAENTYCPSCGKIVIKRYGYYVLFNKIVDGKCPFCSKEIAGIF